MELQDTLKPNPPENESMKKATLVGISVTTVFYVSCGALGYAAFGNNAPGNFLTGFGFYEPYWLIDMANVFIIVHLIGAYQVEDRCFNRWPNSSFIKESPPIKLPLFGVYSFSVFRVVWRTGYVILTIVLAMLLPFFNAILGLLGSASFWPLTVYFPIQMHISREQIRAFSWKWIWLNFLVLLCLIVSVLAAAGSIATIVKDLSTYEPFNSVS
ncbi:hypothetical protein Golob_000392 [Gossypium lobatum]|uniref:Amino acid transporter transmembrane domain-containing protein n=1 Tax=Gossypium lobatum TaxID=34289 RepID=A0A7J8N832_9ROSI|nr:hypothetical protein [Gossypium lobatum]